MKKRFACMLLTLILLVSLVPAAAVPADAASYSVSEAAITVLKKMTTFKSTCYQVADNTQVVRIGYGTECNVGDHKVTKNNDGTYSVVCLDSDGNEMTGKHTISEKKADALLRESLATIDKNVDSFASSNSVSLSQRQHDALVVMTYTIGSAWMNGTSAVKTAIKSGASASELLAAISKTFGETDTVTARAKIVVNMYANGVYSNVVPSSYTKVTYDANGGTVAGSDKYEYYMDTTSTVSHPVTATRNGYTFLGWYLNGRRMTNLTSECGGQTLVAQWQEGTNAVSVDYTVQKSSLASTQLYSAPYTDCGTGKYLESEITNVVISQEYLDSDNRRWGVIAGTAQVVNGVSKKEYGHVGSWVLLVDQAGNTVITADDDVIAKATITYNGYVNVRSAAGTGNTIVGSVRYGETVDIYEMTTVNGHKWGRTDSGWICLTYATVTMLGSNSDVDVSNEGALSYTYSGYATVNMANDQTTEDGLTGFVHTNPTDNSNLIDAKYTDDLVANKSVTITNMTKTGSNLWVKILWSAEYEETVDDEVVTKTTTAQGWVKITTSYYDNSTKYNDGMSFGICSQPIQIWPVEYTVAADEITVRKSASSGADVEFKMNQGVTFQVKTIRLVGEEIWGETVELYVVNDKYTNQDLSDGGVKYNYKSGWVNLSSKYVSRTSLPTVVSTSSSAYTGKIATIVNTDSVNVRITGALYGKKIGTLSRGTTANILEYEDGWYNLDVDVDNNSETGAWVYETYVEVSDGTASSSSTGTTVDNGDGTATTTTTVGTGIVANTYSGVNVRQGAGVSYAEVGKLLPGTSVEILETTTAGGTEWGRTSQGWVCMDYIYLQSTTTTTTTKTTGNGTGVSDYSTVSTSSTTAVYTGYVSSSANDAEVTNNRAGDTGTIRVWPTTTHGQNPTEASGTLSAGDPVTVYELLAVTETVYSTDTTSTDDSQNAESTEGHGSTVQSTTTITSYWARVNDGYIFCPEDNIVLDPLDEEVFTLTASETLNVRATANGTDIGDLKQGDQVKVTNLTIVQDKVWGQIEYYYAAGDTDGDGVSYGWIRLDYMAEGAYYLEKTTTTTTTTTNNTSTGTAATGNGSYLYTGTVTNCTQVNVRNSASTSSGKTTTLKNGASLVIYETTIAENMAWGRCDAGWVYLYYVDLVPATTGAIDARVVYNDNTTIYSDSTGTSTVGSYARMTVVDIYEIVGKMARTVDGWINTDNLL